MADLSSTGSNNPHCFYTSTGWQCGAPSSSEMIMFLIVFGCTMGVIALAILTCCLLSKCKEKYQSRRAEAANVELPPTPYNLLAP